MWQSFVDGKNKLCVSNEILEEYIEILQRLTDNETAEYVVKTILNSPFVELITPFYHFNLITVDPDDNKFVDCAISANAHYTCNLQIFLCLFLEKLNMPQNTPVTKVS